MQRYLPFSLMRFLESGDIIISIFEQTAYAHRIPTVSLHGRYCTEQVNKHPLANSGR